MLISSIRIYSCFTIFLWGLLLLNTTASPATPAVKPVVVYDSSKTTLRALPHEKLEELLNDSDYKYDHVAPASESPWERFKEWFWHMIDSIFSSREGNIGVTVFQYILIAAVLVTIILLLLKNKARALFYGKSASVNLDFSELEENINILNFDELITEAVAKKDFRKAIRLHFLKILKELSDRNLIAWEIAKTNTDYSVELKKSKLNEQFKELAFLYEYVWYGDIPVEEKKYLTLLEKFKRFRF